MNPAMHSAAPGQLPTLGQLVDVAMPPPPGWLPQTAGWAVLGALLVLGALWLLWRGWRRHRANRYRREALRVIDSLRPAVASADAAQRAHALLAMAEVLKRAALAAWPRQQVAALSGAAWAQFLDRHAGGAHHAAAALAPFVADVQYHGASALAGLSRAEAQALIDAGHDWLVGHRVPA